MATIRDVARLAQVSVATVSNVINGSAHVSDDKYNRVTTAMQELKYSPNFLASNLKRNRMRIMGFVVPELTPVYRQIFDGVTSIIEKKGYTLLVRITNYSQNKEEEILKELVNMRLHEIFIISCNEQAPALFKFAIEKKIQLVFFGSCPPGGKFPCINFPNRMIIYNETIRLMKKVSSKKLALVCGPESFGQEKECVLGFTEALPSPIEPVICRIRLTKELAFLDLVNILGNLVDLPEHIIATTQMLAEIVREAYKFLNQKVHISYLAGDDWHSSNTAEFSPLPRQAILLGQQGAELMLDWLSDEDGFRCQQLTVEEFTKSLNNKIFISKKAPLVIHLFEGPPYNSLSWMANAFERKFGIEVQCVPISYHELEAALESGDIGSDLVTVDFQWFRRFNNSLRLRPLDEFLHQEADKHTDTFNDDIWPSYLANGENIYGLPYLTNMQALFYRKDLFENESIRRSFYSQYGVELAQPRSWNDIVLILNYFTKSKNPHSPVTWGTTLSGFSTVNLIEEFFPRQYAFRGYTISPNGNVEVASRKNLRALKNLCQTYECSPQLDRETYVSHDNEYRRILKGETALFFTYVSHIPQTFIGERTTFDVTDLGIIRMPGSMMGGWALSIPRDSAQPENAYSFIRWVTDDHQAMWATLLGSVIPKKSIFRSFEYRSVNPAISYLENNLSLAVDKNQYGGMYIPQANSILSEDIYAALTGQFTCEQALEHADQEIRKLIR